MYSMEARAAAAIERMRRRQSLRGILVLLTVGVLLPVLLSTAVGIISLVLGRRSDPLVVAVLVISFTAAALGGVIAVTVLLGRRARTVREQADLLANVSHEFRTPLTVIQMYAQTLLMNRLKGDPERTKQFLETIIREAKWLEAMGDRVLTWRAVAMDRDLLEMHTAPLRAAVEDAIERFQMMVDPQRLDFTATLESTAPVRHDSNAISTLVLNLLINAYKYTKEEKKIAIRTCDTDGLTEIKVTDNGVGIPRGEVKRIFEPFYRSDENLSSRSSGTGLGLAIVKYLTLAHSGEISVDSQVGRGSSFLVKLPNCQQSPPGTASQKDEGEGVARNDSGDRG